MTNKRRPTLISGLVIAAVFFIGFFLMATEKAFGEYVLFAGLMLGAIYWIWTIIVVSNSDDLKKYQKSFWLIIVITVPFFGALMFNIMHQSRNKMVA